MVCEARLPRSYKYQSSMGEIKNVEWILHPERVGFYRSGQRPDFSRNHDVINPERVTSSYVCFFLADIENVKSF
jgi:hypothetical protein